MDILTVVLWVLLGFGILIIAFVLLPVFLYQSIYKLRTNEKIVFHRFANFTRIVLTQRNWEESWAGAGNERNREKVPDPSTVRVGFWGSWAFGAWPFVLGYRVPTDQFEVPVHASQMYTDAKKKDYPRVRIQGDATLQIRLSDNPIHLGLVFSLFKQDTLFYVSKRARDLTNHELIVKENGREESVKRIAFMLYKVINKPMQEAMRTAATHFTFSVSPGTTLGENEQANDIIEERKEFEKEIRNILTQDDDTIFITGKLLTKREDGTFDTGDSLIVCNIVVENIQPQPAIENESATAQAIDFSFIGHQEGQREGIKQQTVEKLRRVGEADGIEALAEKLGLTTEKQKAFLMDVIRSRGGDLNLTSVNVKDAADVLSAIEGFLKKSNP